MWVFFSSALRSAQSRRPHAENRIVSAVDHAGNQTTYTYDAQGRRVYVVHPTWPEMRIYDLQGHMITGLDASTWAVSGDEVFVGGRHLATYENNTTVFTHADWLGSERVRTALDGTQLEQWASLPFDDIPGTNVASVSPYHFTGKERDAESGLDYFGARYYASSMGRWLSPDWAAKATPVPYAKLSDPQTLNLYAYVRNNPLSHADADGHCFPFCLALPDGGTISSGLAVAGAKVFSAATTAAVATVAAGAAVVGSAYVAITRTANAYVANQNDKAKLNAVESQVGAENNVKLGQPKPGNPATPAPAVPGTQTNPRSNPMSGEPGSTSQTTQPDGTPKQTRPYGPDGHPQTDVDYTQDHGQSLPHAHDWGRPEDGSPPTHKDRGPGRPVTPEDPQPK